METIIWEDPPSEHSSKRFVWKEALEPLVARPGRWAAVHDYGLEHSARATLSLLRNRKVTVPRGRWDFEMGKRDDDRWWIYARFNRA